MSKPNIRKEGTVIDIHFEDEGVLIRATRVWERDRRLESEITVFADLKTKGAQLARIERTNAILNNYAEKRRIISVLDEATYDYEIKWGALINQAFDIIIDLHREGTPAEVQTDFTTDDTPRKFFVHPFIIQGTSNLIYADAGSGKSMFALLTCALVDRGLSRAGISASEGRVLYLDWEEEKSIFRNRLHSILKGLGVENSDQSRIMWKRMDRSLVDEIHFIQALVADNFITYIVLDSLSGAVDGSAVDDLVISNYFKCLRTLGEKVTTLTIDHTNKKGELYGNNAKFAHTRMMYELKKIESYKNADGQSVADIALYHRKVNDMGQSSAKGFEITFYDEAIPNVPGAKYTDRVVFRNMNLGDSEGALQHLSVPELMEEILKNTPNGTLPKDDLINEARRKSTITKDEVFTAEAVEHLLQTSKSLVLHDNDTVGLVYQQKNI